MKKLIPVLAAIAAACILVGGWELLPSGDFKEEVVASVVTGEKTMAYPHFLEYPSKEDKQDGLYCLIGGVIILAACWISDKKSTKQHKSH